MDRRRTITRAEWEARLQNTVITKADLDGLVMDYLVTEGHKEAAEELYKATGCKPAVPFDAITDRVLIRNAVQNGDIHGAIEQVNDLDPEILETNPRLYFDLQLQHLIELIRERKVEEALAFAQDELAPHGEESPELLASLERAMALLMWEDPSTCPMSDLIDHNQRQQVASRLNTVILSSLRQEQEPRLPCVLRTVLWGQECLDESLYYPHITSLREATLQDPTGPDRAVHGLELASMSM